MLRLITLLSSLLIAVSAVDTKNARIATFLRSKKVAAGCAAQAIPCGGPERGLCTDAGTCICASGFGGTDCSKEVPDYLTVNTTAAAPWQDMTGKYKLTHAYLQKTTDGKSRFLHYDDASGGWAVSSFGSGCIDDSCFFAYAPKTEKPPREGYVFGSNTLYMYKAPLIQAVSRFNANITFVTPLQTPEAGAFQTFSGQYELVPFYVHTTVPKYQLFPVDFNTANRNWVLTVTQNKVRSVVLKAIQGGGAELTNNAPVGTVWIASAEAGVKSETNPVPFSGSTTVTAACANHVGDLTCLMTKNQCSAETTDAGWIKSCCRSTCGTCDISRFACSLPSSPKLAP